VYNLVQTSGVGYATGTFQTSATATQYRIAVICINATGGAVSLEFDDFFVGPQVSVSAPAMSDFVSYTATTSGFNIGTTGTATTRWRRVGDSIHVIGRYVAGGTGIAVSGDLRVFLPTGLSFDTSKISITSAVGAFELHNAGAYRYGGATIAVDTTQVAFSIRQNAATLGNFAGTATPDTGWLNAANDEVSFEFMAPIAGWSSNTIASNDTDTRVVSLRVGGSTTTVNTSSPVLVYPNVTIDTHGTYNPSTGVYTVPVSGQYKITANAVTSSVGWLLNDALELSVTVDGVLNQILNQSRSAAASTFQLSTVGTGLINLRAGQLVRIVCYSDKSVALEVGGRSSLTIERLSGPAVIQATDSVNANYFTTSTGAMAVGTSSTVVFGSRSFDSHNAYNSTTGIYTVPISGKYQVNTTITSTSTSQIQSLLVDITKNGSVWNRVTPSRLAAVSSTISVMNSAIVSVNAGDTIEIRCGVTSGTGNFSGQAFENNFTIARVGN
jgi:hypothetical protein